MFHGMDEGHIIEEVCLGFVKPFETTSHGHISVKDGDDFNLNDVAVVVVILTPETAGSVDVCAVA